MHRHTPQNGFSLVEMLIYIAVLLLAAMAAIMTFFSLQDTLERNRVERELSSAATNVLERVTREIRSASSVDNGLSILETSPGILALRNGLSITKFYIATGTVAVSKDGTEIGPLVPRNVAVDSLRFWRYANTRTEAARIELTLSVSNGSASTTKTFYATAVLRGSYE